MTITPNRAPRQLKLGQPWVQEISRGESSPPPPPFRAYYGLGFALRVETRAPDYTFIYVGCPATGLHHSVPSPP